MLPVGPPVEAERADAARNRATILATARRLIDLNGVDALTMDELAREAGIGKGTVFRRFGSRAMLMQSLLNETELAFQRSFLSGPAPLGPDGTGHDVEPVERLIAFGRARLLLVTLQGDLLRAAEESGSLRYSSPARVATAMHISMLLRAAHAPGDIPVLTFNLMSTLEAPLVLHEVRDQSVSMERLADGWEHLVRQVTTRRND
ncbi:MAG: transcriptional regulator [Glaciihabitans sp.]|nr:transcriptional regulator [Glaciihabitans sp.]